MLDADLTMDMIELVDDPSNAERDQVPQSTASSKGIAAHADQGAFFGTSRIVKVLGATLLNMLPLLTFLVRAETRLPGSMTILKSLLARLMISVRCRGSFASVSISYAVLICDLCFLMGGGSGSASSFRNSRTILSCDLRSDSWNLAHSFRSMTDSFRRMKICIFRSVSQENIFHLLADETEGKDRLICGKTSRTCHLVGNFGLID